MKRLTETGKWEDSWFRRLSPTMKCLWLYLVDKCDPAGVIEFDPELASFAIGERVTFKDLEAEIGPSRIVRLEGGERWHMPRFLEFQYRYLSRDCPAHRPIFAALKKHGLRCPTALLKTSLPHRVSHTLKDKEKEKDKDKDRETASAHPRAPAEPPAGVAPERYRPSLAEAQAAAQSIGVTEQEAAEWWHSREATDWLKGTAGGGQIAVGANWQADLKTYANRQRNLKTERNVAHRPDHRTDTANRAGRYA